MVYFVTRNEAEKQYIKTALHIANGNCAHAARILGMSREGLRLKIKRMKITGTHLKK